jgi:hypothetical protein
MPTLVRWGWSLGLLILVVGCGEPAATSGPAAPSGDWLGTTSQRIDATQYAVREVDGALEAGCPAQRLRARFEGEVVTVRVQGRGRAPLHATAEDVEVSLGTVAWGRAGHLQAVSPGTFEVGACTPDGRADAFGECLRRAKRGSEHLTEWWESRPEGLEQGWTIPSPPPGDGPLVIRVEIDGVEPVVDDDAVRLGSLRYDGLAAVDADGRSLPARFAADPAGVAIHVDDFGAAWPIEIDPLLSTAGWTYESDVAQAQLGYSVAGAGDVNGDGFADVVIGAPYYEDGENDEGAAFLFHGSAAGLSTTAGWFVESNNSSDHLGYAVAGVGDLNGDGLSDVGVGVPGYDNGQTSEGAVFLYYGTASGLPTTPTHTLESNFTVAQMGQSLDGAGDFNGDGFGDLVVGAPSYDSAKGAVYTWTGAASGPPVPWATWIGGASHQLGYSVAGVGDVDGDGNSDIAAGRPGYVAAYQGAVTVYRDIASGPSTSDLYNTGGNTLFGRSVAGAGDVNGDGYADVLVGAPEGAVSLGNEGLALLYRGYSGGIESNPSWTARGAQNGARLGNSVAGVGDVNGDGYADMLVGAWRWNGGQSDEGGAFLFLGRADIDSLPVQTPTDAQWTGQVDQASAFFGRSVAGAGDVDGDGYADVIVGADWWEDGETREGGAWLFHGSPAGLPDGEDQVLHGGDSYARLGTSVTMAGDVNGDGLDDFVVGAPWYTDSHSEEGAAFLYLGITGVEIQNTANWSWEPSIAHAHAGSAVAGAGDVNGDGYADVLVGAPNYYMAIADEGAAWLFLGTGSGLANSPSWTVQGGQTGALLGSALSSAGDVNGDGWSDVLVGAPEWDDTLPNQGAVWLHYGTATGLDPTAGWSYVGSAGGVEAGTSVARAGDVNGDSYPDFAIGVPLEGGSGSVHVFHGGVTGPADAAAWTGQQGAAGAEFGASVASAGDVNGDGYDDLVVGAPQDSSAGSAWAFFGSSTGLSATADWSPTGFQVGSEAGTAVASAGDVNGDGYADLVVGAPLFTDSNTGEGAVHLYLGSASGPSATWDWWGQGEESGANLGSSLAGPGDLDGDGFGDLVAGAPLWQLYNTDEGGVFVWHGNSADQPVTARRSWALRARRPSTSVPIPVGLRSPASDSFDARLVLVPVGGFAVVDIQYEVKPVGVPFDGLGLLDSGWIDTRSWTEYTSTLSGLTEDTAYHWRARLLYDPVDDPLQAFSRWVYPSRTGSPGGNQLRTMCTGDVDGDGTVDCVDLDDDDDGQPDTNDCDPLDATVFPGAPETCDLVDSNCDGDLVDGDPDFDGDGLPDCADDDDDDDGDPDATDCDDSDTSVHTGALESCDAIDSDCDGSLVDEFTDTDGDLDPDCTDLDDDDDGHADTADCATLDATIHPGAAELCDDLDSDCDGSIVDEFPDFDGDLEPDCVDLDDDDDGINDSGDCGPFDASIYPGATETCDAVDSDCDGSLVDHFTNTDFDSEPDCIDVDDDGDGVDDTGDCEPLNPTIYPGATELCDAVDSDCDGSLVDEFPDTDGDLDPDCTDPDDDSDGEPDTTDCGPLDNTVYPGAPEACDGLDSDCDTDLVDQYDDFDADGNPDCVDPDDDGDGEADVSDCDDNDATVYNGAPELCDATDSDCDGDLVDQYDDTDGDADPDCTDLDDDGDGDPDLSDCDDFDPAFFAGATELCDGVDHDCDGDLVDGFTNTDGDLEPDCFDLDDDGDLYGDDVDCMPLDAGIHPNAVELCDLIDQDCDLNILEGFDDTNGNGTPDCAEADDDGDLDPNVSDCAPNDSTIHSAAVELCDAIDQNCNGSLIDGFTNTDGDAEPDCIDLDDDGDGDPDTTDCAPVNAAIWTDAPEACDNIDSDCDGSFADEFVDFDGDDDPNCTDSDDDNDGDPDLSDCDDAEATVFVGAVEVCDAVDQDCDGDVVEAFDDLDGDGDPDCSDPDDDNDLFDDAVDCDPLDISIYPGAPEGCDAIDSDCDGSYVDEEDDLNGNGWPDCIDVDSDGDGVPDDADCANNDASIHPGAAELPDDGVDQNCDGYDRLTCWIDADADGAGTGDWVFVDAWSCLPFAPAGGDCDDTDPDNFPGNPEVCDGSDNDCSGSPDADAAGEVDADGDLSLSCDDCDDADPANFPGAPELCDGLDNDCSGAPDADVGGEVDLDADSHLSCADCDDDDPANVPGGEELCDGLDNDCSGAPDADPDGEVDADGDGVLSCNDCDDDDPLAFPGFPTDELCDGVDNDCSGGPGDDEADVDDDGWLVCDGFIDRDLGFLGGSDCSDFDSTAWPGAPESSSDATDHNCDGVYGLDVDGDGYALEDGDCDDGDTAVHPGADELCDGKDTDCDGVRDLSETSDVDGDGSLACADCADALPEIHPGADEFCDGRDSDCDGLMPIDELDLDDDGVPVCAGDCDDEDPAVSPALAEDCANGVDDDCDGTVDVDEDTDADGHGTCSGDCDDGDAAVHPDAVDTCNGVDDDCDGAIDPDFDADGDGWTACGDRDLGDGDCDDGDGSVYPGAPPVCGDGVDNDCDPATFEILDSDGDGQPPCLPDGGAGDCWEGNPLVHPGAQELCDWIDNDCDGDIDEFLDIDEDGQVPCEGDCEEGAETSFLGAVEVCDDGLDGDCDGDIDEDCVDPTDLPDPMLSPPGCISECGVTGARGSSATALVLLLTGMGALRRRR